jgi:uncharacterized membrane protein YphA (DoxX/SURF4 family)
LIQCGAEVEAKGIPMKAVQQVRYWSWRLYHVDENSKATDLGLLALRVAVCLCLIYHHGAEKFYDFHELTHHNLDPVGLGVTASVIISGISDGICSLFVLLGFVSRYAALFVLGVLNTVWWLMDHGVDRLFGLPVPLRPGTHGADLQAQLHTMPSFMNVPLYILGFLAVLLAGPGRYSLDKWIEEKWLHDRP